MKSKSPPLQTTLLRNPQINSSIFGTSWVKKDTQQQVPDLIELLKDEDNQCVSTICKAARKYLYKKKPLAEDEIDTLVNSFIKSLNYLRTNTLIDNSKPSAHHERHLLMLIEQILSKNEVSIWQQYLKNLTIWYKEALNTKNSEDDSENMEYCDWVILLRNFTNLIECGLKFEDELLHIWSNCSNKTKEHWATALRDRDVVSFCIRGVAGCLPIVSSLLIKKHLKTLIKQCLSEVPLSKNSYTLLSFAELVDNQEMKLWEGDDNDNDNVTLFMLRKYIGVINHLSNDTNLGDFRKVLPLEELQNISINEDDKSTVNELLNRQIRPSLISGQIEKEVTQIMNDASAESQKIQSISNSTQADKVRSYFVGLIVSILMEPLIEYRPSCKEELIGMALYSSRILHTFPNLFDKITKKKIFSHTFKDTLVLSLQNSLEGYIMENSQLKRYLLIGIVEAINMILERASRNNISQQELLKSWSLSRQVQLWGDGLLSLNEDIKSSYFSSMLPIQLLEDLLLVLPTIKALESFESYYRMMLFNRVVHGLFVHDSFMEKQGIQLISHIGGSSLVMKLSNIMTSMNEGAQLMSEFLSINPTSTVNAVLIPSSAMTKNIKDSDTKVNLGRINKDLEVYKKLYNKKESRKSIKFDFIGSTAKVRITDSVNCNKILWMSGIAARVMELLQLHNDKSFSDLSRLILGINDKEIIIEHLQPLLNQSLIELKTIYDGEDIVNINQGYQHVGQQRVIDLIPQCIKREIEVKFQNETDPVQPNTGIDGAMLKKAVESRIIKCCKGRSVRKINDVIKECLIDFKHLDKSRIESTRYVKDLIDGLINTRYLQRSDIDESSIEYLPA